MSNGRFVRSRYETDDGEIAPVRVQPETLAATVGGQTNAAPPGPTTQSTSAKISRGNREFGLRPRYVTFAWNPGSAPDGYDERTLQKLPILTEAAYNAITNGAPVAYLGGAGTVVSKTPESVR